MYAVERREKLIRTLVLRGHATVSELAMEFEVSERTILRDIEALSISTPIYTVSGRGGGVYIYDTHILNQPHMKDFESDLLKKIISDTEKYSSCSLSPSELTLLKEIVTLYSKPKYEKGTRQ